MCVYDLIIIKYWAPLEILILIGSNKEEGQSSVCVWPVPSITRIYSHTHICKYTRPTETRDTTTLHKLIIKTRV